MLTIAYDLHVCESGHEEYHSNNWFVYFLTAKFTILYAATLQVLRANIFMCVTSNIQFISLTKQAYICISAIFIFRKKVW